MKFRKLQIAFSAMCVVACVLLIVLWVRSYSKWDRAWLGGFGYHRVQSVRGFIEFDSSECTIAARPGQWGLDSGLADDRFDDIRAFSLSATAFDNNHATFPHWLPILLALAFAIATWPARNWRFSLRTLLIATTLVAMVLGIVVYVGRQ